MPVTEQARRPSPTHRLLDKTTGITADGWVTFGADRRPAYFHGIIGGFPITEKHEITLIPMSHPEAVRATAASRYSGQFPDVQADCDDVLKAAAFIQSAALLCQSAASGGDRESVARQIRRMEELSGLLLEQVRLLSGTTVFSGTVQ